MRRPRTQTLMASVYAKNKGTPMPTDVKLKISETLRKKHADSFLDGDQPLGKRFRAFWTKGETLTLLRAMLEYNTQWSKIALAHDVELGSRRANALAKCWVRLQIHHQEQHLPVELLEPFAAAKAAVASAGESFS